MECFWRMFGVILIALFVFIMYVALTVGVGIYITNKIEKSYPFIIGATIMTLGLIILLCVLECGIINVN